MEARLQGGVAMMHTNDAISLPRRDGHLKGDE